MPGGDTVSEEAGEFAAQANELDVDGPMRQAMAAAEVGDDVLGDDPTIQRLESTIASLAGKDAALFFPSGTQANQVAIHARQQAVGHLDHVD